MAHKKKDCVSGHKQAAAQSGVEVRTALKFRKASRAAADLEERISRWVQVAADPCNVAAGFRDVWGKHPHPKRNIT